MNLQQKIRVYFRWKTRAKKECLQQLSLYEQVLKTLYIRKISIKKVTWFSLRQIAKVQYD